MTQESYLDHLQRVIQPQQQQPPPQPEQKQRHHLQEEESEKQSQKQTSTTKHIIPIMVVGAQQPPSQHHSKLNETTYRQGLDYIEKNKKLVIMEDSCSASTHHPPITRRRQVTFQLINPPQQAEKRFNYQSIHRQRSHRKHTQIMNEIQRQESNNRSNFSVASNSVRLSFNTRNIDIPLKAVLRIKYRNSKLNDKIRPLNALDDKIIRKPAIYANHYRCNFTSKNKIDSHKCNKSYRTNFNKLRPDCRLCLAFLRYLNDQDQADFRDICKNNNIEICD
jgi:hypothetical protein